MYKSISQQVRPWCPDNLRKSSGSISSCRTNPHATLGHEWTPSVAHTFSKPGNAAGIVIVILSWPSYLKLPTGSILCGIPQITRSELKEVFSQSCDLCLCSICKHKLWKDVQRSRCEPIQCRISSVRLVKELITHEEKTRPLWNIHRPFMWKPYMKARF